MDNDKLEKKSHTLPAQALHVKDLIFTQTPQTEPEKSGHPVSKVQFQDKDGTLKTGFFKPLDATYPELLCMISVAAGVYLRMLIGNRAAEERLIFNENGDIIGSLSIGIDNYTPLATTFDKNTNEYNNPSVHSLLTHNIALLLVVMWYLKNDDLHPGNISLNHVIDYDMILYTLTSIIKGARWFCGDLIALLEKGMPLQWTQIDNFPNNPTSTHFPSLEIPGNKNFLKTNKSVKQFQKLAENPSIKDEKNQTISFQSQMFASMLQILLAHNPLLLRARLQEYIGDIPLDYLNETKLEASKAEKLSLFNPELFNTSTNKQPFVNMMCGFIQKEYDEFYRTVVFYPGCEKNEKGVSVPAFHFYLRSNPQAFYEIKKWMQDENNKIKEKSGILDKKRLTTLLFDRHYIDAKYFQVLRDSHLFVYDGLLNHYERFLTQLSKGLNILHHFESITENIIQENSTLTQSSQVVHKKNKSLLSFNPSVLEKKPLTESFTLLLNYVNELYDICNVFAMDTALKKDTHTGFCKKIFGLSYTSGLKIKESLEETQYLVIFQRIQDQLEGLTTEFQQVDLQSIKKIQKNTLPELMQLVQPNHTESHVIQHCIHSFFNWAKNSDIDILTDMISNVINTEYLRSSFNIKNLFTTQARPELVTSYLKTSVSEKIPGHIILAHVLSDGGREETSLNTLLIKSLFPLMIEAESKNTLNVNTTSVQLALKNNTFNLAKYTHAICNEALKIKEKYISHKNILQINKKNRLESFNELMYYWANKTSKEIFQKLIHNALNKYDPPNTNNTLSLGAFSFNSIKKAFSNKNRRPAITAYLQNLARDPKESNAHVLALIFSEGEWNNNSLNTLIFTSVFQQMQLFKEPSKQFEGLPGYSVLCEMRLNTTLYKKCIESIPMYCKAWTYMKHDSLSSEKSSQLMLNTN